MADVVVLLGAGCSRSAGAPLMNDFLDRARALFDLSEVEPWRTEFQSVFDAVGRLGAVHSKSQLDVVNLEAVFNAFEMALQLRKFPGMNDQEIEGLIPAIKTVIVRTLEQTIQFPFRDDRATPPADYAAFADTLRWIGKERKPRLSVAVMTFNYDIALDVALLSRGFQFTYGLDEASLEVGMPLLKLHGSLNWFLQDSGQIKALDVYKLLSQRMTLPGDMPSTIPLPVSREHPDLARTGPQALPFIVPPTMSKGEHHRQILPVWRRAAKELGQARHIFICGYSLPSTDEFFRVLYALGSQGPETLRNVVVLDPDSSVHQRVRSMLGPAAIQRFSPTVGGFEGLPSLMRSIL
jgi:hypothetical protein